MVKHPHWLDKYVSLPLSLFELFGLDTDVFSPTCQPINQKLSTMNIKWSLQSVLSAGFFVACYNVDDCRSETLLLRKRLLPSKKHNKVLDTHKL